MYSEMLVLLQNIYASKYVTISGKTNLLVEIKKDSSPYGTVEYTPSVYALASTRNGLYLYKKQRWLVKLHLR